MQIFALTLNRSGAGPLWPRLHEPTVRAQIESALAASPELAEVVCVATCLRLEVYAAGRHPEAAREALRAHLFRILGAEARSIDVGLLLEQDAARHLLRVTSGMESILWGETAVTGQVRAAYRTAVDRALIGPLLHRLFHLAFRTARRLRADGAVAPIASSLSALALGVARRELGQGRRSLLILGAGQAGQSGLREARAWGFTQLTLAGSRRLEVEEAAAAHGARPLVLRDGEVDALRAAAAEADAILAVSSRGEILNDTTLDTRDPSRELLLLDLAVPANSAPVLPRGVRRVDLDRLADLARDQQAPRASHAANPWDLVLDDATREFLRWREGRAIGVPSLRTAEPGRVYLVGAGPGDPELLTLRAARLLETADVVFHDALLPPKLLECIPASARRVPVGRRAGFVVAAQREVERAMAEWAARGARVVRLKGGDPSLFGRVGEELRALHEAGIEVEVVPGVTAATAAAATAAAPLTERGIASSCTLVTFHAQAGDPDPAGRRARFVDLARAADTLAVYMAGRELVSLASALAEAGRDPNESILVIERASHPEERVRPLTLAALANFTGTVETPAIILVGPIAQPRAARPLGVDLREEVR